MVVHGVHVLSALVLVAPGRILFVLLVNYLRLYYNKAKEILCGGDSSGQ